MTFTAMVPLSISADRALEALRGVGGSEKLSKFCGADLLLERALLNRYQFCTDRTAAGTCRLLSASDGLLAINLPREEDWQLVPAWVESTLDEEFSTEAAWSTLTKTISKHKSSRLIARAHDLGLAVSSADKIPEAHMDYCQTLLTASPDALRRNRKPRVVDLSALWAGPLCSHLLQLLGAEVIKVESTTRPDGARSGDVAFYELLNQSKRSVAIDFGTQQGLQDLKMLLSSADIIIESSRPRALLQLGIDPRKVVKNRRGVTWIQLTAHGSELPESHWIGYGDDAAAAAGLCAQLHRITGQYGFVGDAIADPLTGLYAALSAWRSWANGGGEMIGLSLRQVTSFCIQRELAEHRFQFEHQLGAWQQLMASLNSHFDAACALNSEEQPSYFSDRTRICEGRVAAFGEDTTMMLKEARALSS